MRVAEHDPARITDYHAHVYYDETTRRQAARLRRRLDRLFPVRLGRWRDRPVGPHPRAMYQVTFEPHEFARIVPWLMLNRDGLVIFIHPNTGAALADHRDHALWLGEKLALDLGGLG